MSMLNASKKIANVIDVGSSNLWAVSGTHANGNLSILADVTVPYSGFFEGEFLEEGVLPGKIFECLKAISSKTGFDVSKLGVSVPSEFCLSQVEKVNVAFTKQTKLTPSLLEEIYASSAQTVKDFTPINFETLFGVLDNQTQVVSPLGHKALQVELMVNIIYARTSFIDLFNKALKKCGVQKVDYINSALAVVQNCLAPVSRKTCVIDIGYLSTSVCVALGGGLESLFSFSLGGATMETDLMEECKISYEEAVYVKKNLVLSLNQKTADFYAVSNQIGAHKILAYSANKVAFEFLDALAEIILECLDQKPDQNTNFFLIGGGVSYINGAKEFLAQKLGGNITFLSSNILGYNKPHQTSVISLFLSQISH